MQNRAFIDAIKKHCICMAGNDVEYNNLSEVRKAKGEFQFLKRSLSSAPHGIHQGTYLVSPSGKLIKKINWGWPHPDTRQMNRELAEGLASYKAMTKSDRLGKGALADSERSLTKKRFIQAPTSWLQLRNTSRGYAFAEMNLFDIRHPVYNKIDKLWFSDTEKLKLVPRSLEIGTTQQVDKHLLTRLLTNSHLMLSPAAWWDEHIKSATMTMTVKSKNGSKILIHYQGAFHQDADSKWNQSSFKAKLLGKAIWDTEHQRFDQFTWVGLGDHTLRNLKSNMHRGSTKTIRIASLLELDPKHKSEADLAPFHWGESYPRSMQAQANP